MGDSSDQDRSGLPPPPPSTDDDGVPITPICLARRPDRVPSGLRVPPSPVSIPFDMEPLDGVQAALDGDLPAFTSVATPSGVSDPSLSTLPSQALCAPRDHQPLVLGSNRPIPVMDKKEPVTRLYFLVLKRPSRLVKSHSDGIINTRDPKSSPCRPSPRAWEGRSQ